MMIQLNSLALFALLAASSASAFVTPGYRKVVVPSKTSLNNGMDAYEAQMRALTGGGAPAAPQPVAATPPPVAPQPVAAAPPQPAAAVATPAAAAGGNPIATLDASQKASVDAIAAAIPDLAVKPDLSWGPADGVTIAGMPATLDGRDAPGPANVGWLASVCVQDKLSSLTIFNGPLTNVPHLLSRCSISDDDGTTLSFALDFRPRAYGAYELRDAAGNYPGPDELGRVAFEYSGNRAEFFNNFGNDEVSAFMEATLASFDGAVDATDTSNELDMLTRGPLAISVTMPLTDANVAAVVAAREQAASYWLSWATDNSFEHRPGAPVNTQYVYDTKYKQNCYGGLLPIYTALYGPDGGNTLTAAESGPLDEAYVGGGS